MLGVEPILERRGVDMDEDGRQARPARIGETESRRMHREGVGERRAFEHRQRWQLVTGRIHAVGVANRAISLSREYLRARTANLHLYRAELAIEGGVPGRVGQQVVELIVFVDPPEGRPQIVGLLDE